MSIQNIFDLYFENRLSDKEKKEFEKSLAEDHELAETFRAYIHVNHMLESELISPVFNHDQDPLLSELNLDQKLSIEDDFRRFRHDESKQDDGVKHLLSDDPQSDEEDPFNSFNPMLKEVKGDYGKKGKIPGREKLSKLSGGNNSFIIRIAGVAAVLAFSFLIIKFISDSFISAKNKLNTEQLYAKFYNPVSDNELKNLDLTYPSLQDAFSEFKRSNRNPPSFNKNDTGVQTDEYQLSMLFSGIIYMERNDFHSARECFQKILAYQNPQKVNTVYYYLALSYLKDGFNNEAVNLLKKLSEFKNPYRRDAKAILKSVKHP